MSPSTPVYLALYATALQNLKQGDKLKPLLPRLAALETDNAKALSSAAVVLGNEGDLKNCLRLLRMAFRSLPWDMVVNEDLGVVFTKLGPPDSAIYYLGRCIPKEPEARREQLLAALIQEQMKGAHPEEAQNSLAEFMRQFPSSKNIARLKSLVYPQK